MFAAIGSHDLVITSYGLVRRDLERHQALEFDTVVLDEAQHIKNPATRLAKQMIEAGEFDAGRAIITVVPEVIRTNDGPATLSWFDRAYAAVRYRLPVPNGWL